METFGHDQEVAVAVWIWWREWEGLKSTWRRDQRAGSASTRLVMLRILKTQERLRGAGCMSLWQF